MNQDVTMDSRISSFVPNGSNKPDGRKLTLLHSLGYECQRHYNLCVPDETSLLFCSGSLLHMFDTVTKQLSTRRSDRGVCLGFVTKNPVDPHIAVGEKGLRPSIIIYKWPSFDIVQKLKNGTTKDYVFLTYSPDGSMLCAQGGDPDHTMTLWDWCAGTIVARTSSPYSFRVHFSNYTPNYIVSCGEEGITFWQLTKTYTGMKLLRERGHFNVLDECEVLAVYIMPDGQVVSGCSWGNILVWAGGRVVVEACQRQGQACHNGPIVNFTYNQEIDELYTVGKDGWIKMWHYGRFKPDPLSDELTVVIKPVFEIQVYDDQGPSVLSYILKKNNDPNDSTWFSQDRNGALWQVDMQVSATVVPSARLHTCHAGPVLATAASPLSHHFASLAANGVLHVYCLVTGHLLAVRVFPVGGTKLFWLLIQGMSGEETLAAGFADGTLRILSISSDGDSININQESKPHQELITAISVSRENDTLVTGSEDRTVFVYKLQVSAPPLLVPLGYLQLHGPVRSFSWNPNQTSTLLICCPSSLNEVLIPSEVFTGTSYKLTPPITTTSQIKSGDSTVENLLDVVYSNSGSIYLAASNGLYEYDWETKSVLNQIIIEESISCIKILSEGNVWFLGLKSGKLRTLTRSPAEWAQQDEDSCQDTSLHDTETGAITDICLSCDFRHLVSCGQDGNLFVYSVNLLLQPEPVDISVQITQLANATHKSLQTLSQTVKEVVEGEPSASLEEAKKESVLREKLAVSMMKKKRVQRQLVSLRFKYCQLLKRNNKLPESQRLPKSAFCLDKRLQFHIKSMIDTDMKLVKHKLKYEVEKSQLKLNKLKGYFIDCLAAFDIEISVFRGKKSVATFVHRKLGKEFEDGEAIVKQLLQKALEKTGNNSTELIQKPAAESSAAFVLEVESEEPYLRSVQDIYNKLSIKTKRSLDKHKLMKKKKEERKKQWQAFMATQPDQEKNLASDVAAIDHAMRTIGDYKLKCSKDFKLPDQSKNTSLHKLNQLIDAKREIFNLKEDFNHKVYALRDQKVKLISKMKRLEDKLVYLHKELPEESRILPPPLPQLNVAKEFPERQYQIYPGKEPGITSPTTEELDEEFFVLYGKRNGVDQFYSAGVEQSNQDEQLEDTLWETQMRSLRKTRQLFKQDQIIQVMERLLTEFDQQVEELIKERMQLSIDIKYLESFVSVLHQELHIMLSYNDSEAAILERVNTSLMEKHTKHLKMNILQHKIDARTTELELLEEKLDGVEKSFTELTAGNRVVKHLTRIFRKKYRPHLLSTEEEDGGSEEGSSSEDTSEDSDSINVGKPSPRRDDSKCPADCDKEIHKEVVQLRTIRHNLEAKITLEKTAIDQMTREKVRSFKFLKLIEPVLRMNQDQLEKLQKEKQKKLNEVEVLVILNCSQICGQNLLMSREDLDKLRARVSELQRQTDMQLEKLKKNQRYQQRLAEESFGMDLKISQLKKDIDKAMICKFGQPVDVEVLEEEILEQMIKKTRESLREEELHKKYEKKIKNLKEELLEKTEDLADLMRENTHKLQMLSSLEEEKQKLIALATRVNKAAAEINDRETEYTQDVRKLTRILQNLVLQKETIIHDIKVLSLKGRPLPPIPQSVVEEATKSTTTATATVQSQSRDSDDVATTECQTTRDSSDLRPAQVPKEPDEEDAGCDPDQESQGSDFLQEDED